MVQPKSYKLFSGPAVTNRLFVRLPIEMSDKNFEKLILPLRDKLYRFALRMLKHEQEAEDVLQEVFLKLWQKESYLTNINNYEAWTVRMVRNRALDILKSKRYMEVEVHERDSLDDRDPQTMMEGTDTMALIEQAVAHLPLVQQQIFHLRDVEGMDNKEIAQALDMPETQVKVYLHRARKALKAQIIKYESYGT